MDRAQAGFTLWELMLTLIVGGVVLGIGVPSFREFQRGAAITAATNELLGGLMLARTEAVKRQVPVTLCASPDPEADPPACEVAGSNGAFVVFVDENGDGDVTDATDGNAAIDSGEVVLLRRATPRGSITVSADSGYVAFRPSGFTDRANGHPDPPASVVLLCDDRGNRPTAGGSSSARVVRIERTGRATVRQQVEDIAEAMEVLADAGVAADCD